MTKQKSIGRNPTTMKPSKEYRSSALNKQKMALVHNELN